MADAVWINGMRVTDDRRPKPRRKDRLVGSKVVKAAVLRDRKKAAARKAASRSGGRSSGS